MGRVLRPRAATRARRRPVQLQLGRQLRSGRIQVPTLLASPYAQPGFADHTVYDHTSILRFLEWRFLGAPATGSKKTCSRWWLTKRDRNAANLGASLRVSNPDPELRFAFDDSDPDLSTEMIVPCNQFVGVNKVEAEWGVDTTLSSST